jgi:Tfp pilus assembly pilus retraction ATPase PilT
MDITELLAFSAKQGASDLHLSAGLPPMIRVDGDVRRINLPPLEHQEVHGLIYEIMNDKQRKDFEEFLEIDFSFEVPGVACFHVNSFQSIDHGRFGYGSGPSRRIHGATRPSTCYGSHRLRQEYDPCRDG